eukprot:8954983-Pyramimonas_sp.AAC.2
MAAGSQALAAQHGVSPQPTFPRGQAIFLHPSRSTAIVRCSLRRAEQYDTVRQSRTQRGAQWAVKLETSVHSATHSDTALRSATRCDAVRHSATQYDTVRHSAMQYGTVRYSTPPCDTVRHRAIPYDTVRYSMPQC